MTTQTASVQTQSVSVPNIPALYVNAKEAFLLSIDGEVSKLTHEAAKRAVMDHPVLVCHAPYTCKRLGIEHLAALDILELFAFVHPATFAVPTPVGMAKALGLPAPAAPEDYPFSLMESVGALLSDLRKDPWKSRADPIKIAGVMAQNGKGWRWSPHVFAALGRTFDNKEIYMGKADLNIWKSLPEWAESAPPPPSSHHPVTGEEARQKLKEILGSESEQRETQMEYTAAVTGMFMPPSLAPFSNDTPEPNAVLVEAGTGVGKTLGYLAPAALWANKNKGSVWVSTYTKNLQRQINQELEKIYPDADMKDSKVTIRKGRENYLCLLNFEDIAAGASLAKHPNIAIAAGLMARWAAATRDGDLSGGDFPGWLSGLVGPVYTTGLADKRGECIYSACDHYHRCFVERSVRRARHADIVVANHALVIIQTADANADSDLPQHYIFDEGHHLFDAADSAYAGHLTGLESYELRRWLRGNEGGKKSRARGLKRRAEDCVEGDETLTRDLQDVLESARCLATEGWGPRLKENAPANECESFLLEVWRQVYARAEGRDGPYSLETDTYPVTDELKDAGKKLKSAQQKLQTPLLALANGLRKKLNDQADTLEADMRRRLDALTTSIMLRANMIGGWIQMLETLDAAHRPEQFIDWMEIERIDGRTYDVGLYRHWIDPMIPFATSIKPHALGITVTSATLRDGTGNEDEDWRVARDLSGLSQMGKGVYQEKFTSPFDYPACSKVFIINDVRKDDLAQVSSAYKTLFESSGGGALGIFTAISRLRAVHDKIAGPLEERGLHLYAQHVDAMDNGTLVDIFRDDTNACLLGTDAVRDGVDVPGDSLRLIVFDRVPWPRPTIMHRARREAFGKKQYDERLTRLKLKQAFGRLIRRNGDKGVFVMLDSMMPSRLNGAFPDGVEVIKCGLSEATSEIKKFLA